MSILWTYFDGTQLAKKNGNCDSDAMQRTGEIFSVETQFFIVSFSRLSFQRRIHIVLFSDPKTTDKRERLTCYSTSNRRSSVTRLNNKIVVVV
jgi:hypothetical protein